MNKKAKVVESRGLTLFDLYSDTFNHVTSFLEFDELVGCVRVSTECQERVISILRDYTDEIEVAGWSHGSVEKYCKSLRKVNFLPLDTELVRRHTLCTSNKYTNDLNRRISSICQILDNNQNITRISCLLNGIVIDTIPPRVPTLLNELNLKCLWFSDTTTVDVSLSENPAVESILKMQGKQLKRLHISSIHLRSTTEVLQHTPLLEDLSFQTSRPKTLVDLKAVFKQAPKLTRLCFDYPPTHLDDIQILSSLSKLKLNSCGPNLAEAFVRPFPNLTDLDMMFKYGFDFSKFGAMFPILTDLRLTFSPVEKYKGFAEMLKYSKRLKNISLATYEVCRLSYLRGEPQMLLTEAIKSLARSCVVLPNMMKLVCDVECISADDVDVIGTVFPNLESLELEDQNSVGSIVEIMRASSRIDGWKLKKLVCNCNALPPFEELKFLCERDCFPNLQSLDFLTSMEKFRSNQSSAAEEVQEIRECRKDVVCYVSPNLMDKSDGKTVWSLRIEYIQDCVNFHMF